MPIFEYRCEDCGQITELVESRTGRIPSRVCRSCGSRRMKKEPSKFIYHREVTLQDLGVNVIPRQPMPAAPGMAPAAPQPPPGWDPSKGCPIHGCAEGGDASGDED